MNINNTTIFSNIISFIIINMFIIIVVIIIYIVNYAVLLKNINAKAKLVCSHCNASSSSILYTIICFHRSIVSFPRLPVFFAISLFIYYTTSINVIYNEELKR